MLQWVTANISVLGSILLGLLLLVSEVMSLINGKDSSKATGILDGLIKALKDAGVKGPGA